MDDLILVYLKRILLLNFKKLIDVFLKFNSQITSLLYY